MVAWIALSGIVSTLVVLLVVWFVLVETSIEVEPGTLALLLKRGAATDRALAPGRHFIQPWRKAMVEVYPSRELALVAGGLASGDERVDTAEAPLRLHLGDKTFATLSYTVRCQLDPTRLREVHDQFGPEGIWSALRDTTRSSLIAEAGADEVSVDDAFGDRFAALEQRFETALAAALGGIGFELKMFNLREIDLGETGEIIQSTLRADAELEREQAMARVRQARLENDTAMAELAAGIDGDVLLRYRQLESWREILLRWDGDQAIPSALSGPLVAASEAQIAHRDEQALTEEATVDGRVVVSGSPWSGESADARRSSGSKHPIIEVVTVVLLAIASVGSAWSAFQVSQWNGTETDAARASAVLRIESSREYALATQTVAYDAAAVSQYAAIDRRGERRAADVPARDDRATRVPPDHRPVEGAARCG